MKNIRELIVTQIRIFPADYIPYSYLLRKEFIDYIVEKYNFDRHQMPFENIPVPASVPRVLILESGEYKIDNKKVIIKRVAFEDRRLITEVISPSKVSTKFFNAFSKDIKKFDSDGYFKASDANYFSEETTCIVSLDVDFMDIYSNKFRNFLSKDFAKHLKHKPFEIYPRRTRFEVNFEPDEKLLKYRITLAAKTLVIEPKAEHSLDEKVYFTSSPCDSDTHLNLLKSYEESMK
jgi:hypothetical protein